MSEDKIPEFLDQSTENESDILMAFNQILDTITQVFLQTSNEKERDRLLTIIEKFSEQIGSMCTVLVKRRTIIFNPK